MKKDLLAISDIEPEDIEEIFSRAEFLKRKFYAGEVYQPLKGKTLGMIFKKSSTRTRISFEAGMYQLGGHAIFLSSKDLQMDRGESIADTAKIFSLYLNGIVIRTYSQEEVEELAANSSIPVINGLTDLHHPCQILCDMFTIKEKLGRLEGVKVAYIGDGNNIANSWLDGASKMGMNLSISSPAGYEPDAGIVKRAALSAGKNSGKIEMTNDPFEAVRDADIIYTDVWTSMGQEREYEKRLKDFRRFQVNTEMVRAAKKNVLVMHCLPAHRGEEISDDVIDGERSIVFEEAENRLHVQKAILELLMGGKK
ncbi:MAG: ornithine carbamoyltransferase [Nitrospinae bacterium]|nr:ornithine carbamoyltransferase [Nitrospinota bacterium]